MNGAITGGNGPFNAALVEFGKSRVQSCGGTNADITSIVSMITRLITSIVLRLSFATASVVFCNDCGVLV